MNYLILTRGNCASGKSTWIQQNGLKPYTISADDVRLLHQGPVLTKDGNYAISQKNDKLTWELIHKLLDERMKRGEFCVVDGTHNNCKLISAYKHLIDQYRYRCYLVDFSDVPLEICKERNRQRDAYKFVPEEVLDRIDARLRNFNPQKYATLIKPDKFWSSIERKPENYDKYERVVVFGDSHSCFDPITTYFQGNPEREDFLYIHLGDMFDRGPQPEEWGRFLLEYFNRPNWIWLQSNHNLHLTNWAFDRKVKSNEFLFNTAPALEKVADKKVWRSVARKFWQCAHFTYGPNEYLLTHGGLPKMPGPREMPLIASDEFYRGVGRYEELPEVAASWDRNSAPNQYQIHGHRSDDVTKNIFFVGNRSICLDGKVELGNSQKIVELHKTGNIVDISIKNTNIRSNYRTNEAKDVVAPMTNADFLSSIRNHKGVRENKMGHISSFNFKNKVFYDRSWDNISEMARGLFINNESGEVVARGWKKFFNYQEREDTRPEWLRDNFVFPCEIYVKENGFLGLLGYDNSRKELVFCTKSSISNNYNQNFERIIRKTWGNRIDEIEEYLANNNKCMAFEVIDPINDPHIQQYLVERVILLEIFERSTTIQKVPYPDMIGLCEKWLIDYKDRWGTLKSWGELDSFINWANDYHGVDNRFVQEGYVIEDATGHTFKLKTPGYLMWKKMRGIIHGMSRGHKIPYSKLISPLENDFIGWASKLDREELNASIIELRNRFYA